jgi:hypothetical protein
MYFFFRLVLVGALRLFFMYEAHACPLRFGWGREATGCTRKGYRTSVGPIGYHPAQNFDQGGFARAVLAAQRVDFIGAEVEVHAAERAHAGVLHSEVAGG